MKDQDVEKDNINPDSVLHFLCPVNDTFPNNDSLELCVLKQVFSPGTINLVEVIEQCFLQNGWSPEWRNGLYEMHHYDRIAHEALGICEGWVEAFFGGLGGIVQTATAGDVIIIPAGVSHKNVKQSENFKVVGAHPEGQPWNMKYGRQGERPQVD
jgi:uncharacterized protein YjlB